MATSDPGSSHPAAATRWFAALPREPRGFTLLELMVVITLIALASTVVVLSLPDPTVGKLEREATRLASLFEAARAQARTLGLTVRWLPNTGERAPDAGDFRFAGLPDTADLPTRWLEPGVSVDIADPRGVLLGPEPVVGPQRVLLHLHERHLTIATDGLGPFVTVVDAAPEPGR